MSEPTAQQRADYESKIRLLEAENRSLRAALNAEAADSDCACMTRCGDVAAEDDRPGALCRGLRPEV